MMHGPLDVKFVSGEHVLTFISLYFTGSVAFETCDFEGCSQLEFTAQLEGGVGDCAWQHAQLFRQKITDDDYSLDITIRLKQQL
jgi:hypothetical protein